MISLFKTVALLILGAVIGVFIYLQINPQYIETDSTTKGEDEPLYWVAPMDSSYRRDKPGLSPMGMELVPVYADEASEEAGTVSISPDVVNNLGVTTARVKKDVLQQQIKTVGYVQYDEDQLIHIHPRVEGWIEKLYVKASGEPVKKGQPLYTLYSPALVNAQDEYVIAIKRKNARLVQAAEDRLNALQLPSSAIRQLKKTLQVKQNITFYAPQSGVITELRIREGFFVKPDTSMMSIGVLDKVWVQVEVFEQNAEKIKVGQQVIMTLAHLPGREWLGQVDYIYPTLNADTRTLKVRLKFDNQDQALMPNMFAQVRILLADEQKTVLVPNQAVIRTGDMNRVVLALGEGKFRSTQVQLGRSDNQHTEILNGLQLGDTVVTSAQFLIDSESSKTADFNRMHHQQTPHNTVDVDATILHVMPENEQISLSHQVIEQWNRPAMTMTLSVAEDIDLTKLENGQIVTISLSENVQGNIYISAIHPHQHQQMNTEVMGGEHDH